MLGQGDLHSSRVSVSQALERSEIIIKRQPSCFHREHFSPASLCPIHTGFSDPPCHLLIASYRLILECLVLLLLKEMVKVPLIFMSRGQLRLDFQGGSAVNGSFTSDFNRSRGSSTPEALVTSTGVCWEPLGYGTLAGSSSGRWSALLLRSTRPRQLAKTHLHGSVSE